MDNLQQKRSELIQFLEEYADFFERAAMQEAEKQAALKSNKLAEIERTLARQQAVVMEMGNLEKRREELQRAAGMGEKTFRQIVSSLEGTEQERCAAAMDRMEEAIAQMKADNQQSMQIAKEKMGLVEKLLPETERSSQSLSPYNKKGQEKGNRHIFESKI